MCPCSLSGGASLILELPGTRTPLRDLPSLESWLSRYISVLIRFAQEELPQREEARAAWGGCDGGGSSAEVSLICSLVLHHKPALLLG